MVTLKSLIIFFIVVVSAIHWVGCASPAGIAATAACGAVAAAAGARAAATTIGGSGGGCVDGLILLPGGGTPSAPVDILAGPASISWTLVSIVLLIVPALLLSV